MLIMRMSAAAVRHRHANWTNGNLLQPPQCHFRPLLSKTEAYKSAVYSLNIWETVLNRSCNRDDLEVFQQDFLHSIVSQKKEKTAGIFKWKSSPIQENPVIVYSPLLIESLTVCLEYF